MKLKRKIKNKNLMKKMDENFECVMKLCIESFSFAAFGFSYAIFLYLSNSDGNQVKKNTKRYVNLIFYFERNFHVFFSRSLDLNDHLMNMLLL